ncbi:MAG: SAM-dependent methyltransferase [Cyclobacteriaceae bacterium]|nr:SAM-dependent methyltransferase [Cyclobacteriaceae bacterium]
MPGKGTLYLIPTTIADDTAGQVIPAHVTDNIRHLRHFLAEDVRTARRYLSSLKIFPSIEDLQFSVLNKHTSETELAEKLLPLTNGNDVGVLSESGCPGVADPGALAVAYAHQQGIRVMPLVGPSSLLLALMASGLNGQHFAFHGYLPVDTAECRKAIRTLEQESRQKNQTQVFIETPYRNNAVFSNLLKSLHDETRLCVAIDVTGKEESIQTMSVRVWKKVSKSWPKLPAVFLFLA